MATLIPTGQRWQLEHRELKSPAQGHTASENLSSNCWIPKPGTESPLRVLCCLLPPPSRLVLTLSQVCKTQPGTKRLILYTHLRRLFLGVQPLSTPGLPLSQPPSWEGLSDSALALAWVLEACASMAEAPNSFRHQARMTLGLSDISQVLRQPKTYPIAFTELGPCTEDLHPGSELRYCSSLSRPERLRKLGGESSL